MAAPYVKKKISYMKALPRRLRSQLRAMRQACMVNIIAWRSERRDVATSQHEAAAEEIDGIIGTILSN